MSIRSASISLSVFALLSMNVFAEFCMADELVFLPSLSQTEITLHDDSTMADSWGAYGLAALATGDSSARWALQRSEIMGESSLGTRGLASFQVQSGDMDEAVDILSSYNGADRTALVDFMLCCILQETGDLYGAETLIDSLETSSLPSSALILLRMRQARASGSQTELEALRLEASRLAEDHFTNLAHLEMFLFGEAGCEMEPGHILAAMKADIALTGSVYQSHAVTRFSGDGAISENPFLAASVHSLTGDIEEALLIMEMKSIEEMDFNELVLYTKLLTEDDRLNDAETVTEYGLERYPESPELYGTLGLILLSGGNYRDAYNRMDEAIELTDSPLCMAVMGLAAEKAIEPIWAVYGFAPLLEMSEDSIVLINRTRNWLRRDELYGPAGTASRAVAWQNSGSGINGNLSVSYYRSTGEYSQENVSLGGGLYYMYGLYNSRISLSASYSNNDWPGAETSLQRLYTSMSWKNCTSRNFFQTLSLNHEDSKDDTRRWKMEALAEAGYSISLGDAVEVVPTLGGGRIVNKWDDEMYQRDSWVYTGGLSVSLMGFLPGTIQPHLSLRADFSRDFDDPDQYEIDTRAYISASLNSKLSLSYSYDIDYESIVPPENESQTNTSSRASLNFHF